MYNIQIDMSVIINYCIIFTNPVFINNYFIMFNYTVICLIKLPFPTLALEDLYDIKSELITIVASWKEIGIGLGLHPGKLDAIDTTTKLVCLSEMLITWLKKDYDVVRFGEPTWRRIVETVADPAAGGDPALAITIAKKHLLTGKYTILGQSWN